LCQWRPEVLIEPFTRDREVVAVGALYLRIVSWNFVANGLIFTCSSLFQALGNTWPSLLSSGLRLLTFVLRPSGMSTLPHFELKQLWYLSVCSTALQAATSSCSCGVSFAASWAPCASPLQGCRLPADAALQPCSRSTFTLTAKWWVPPPRNDSAQWGHIAEVAPHATAM